LTEQKLIGSDALDGGALPIWIPPGGDDTGAVLISPARAVSHGLGFRPLEQTVRDTLEWQKQRPAAQQTLRVGLSAQREVELLKLRRGS
jgi:2'-hydroxyisoflavone reductase